MSKKPFFIRALFRILLGLMLAFAGISHLTIARTEFLAQVPDWVPLNKDTTVLLSGIAEITLGLLLAFWKRKERMMGWIVALFFIAVFPGNLHQYKYHIDAFSLNTDQARLIRLFFQPVLVVWALWSTGILWKQRGDDK
ncbi:MAG: hypothetical protein DI535_15660 [Citrobacter freundii]|nr:MAG: hypothetical protein DI535_15660 [Citrobacter freundii]